MKPNVQVIALLPDNKRAIPPEYEGLFQGMRVFIHGLRLWQDTYHHVFWPTIIGVDGSNFVTHVQYGFDNAIDYQLAERFFVSIE